MTCSSVCAFEPNGNVSNGDRDFSGQALQNPLGLPLPWTNRIIRTKKDMSLACHNRVVGTHRFNSSTYKHEPYQTKKGDCEVKPEASTKREGVGIVKPNHRRRKFNHQKNNFKKTRTYKFVLSLLSLRRVVVLPEPNT